ncbi:MAG: efflux RND transporter periplasmic adaptor subunit [Mangrovibacterium sp.]|nr:efflux RND transporter periplasmic adaptor subunit [Mangrovibacterium sp.]
MKKIILVIVIVVIVAAGFVVAGLLSPKKDAIQLETEKVGRATISNTVTATGTLEANVTVEVGTQVSGRIDRIYVDNNSIVKKDQLIARLDTQALSSTLAQSKATLDQAQAEYEYQKANYERYARLIDKKLIAQKDFDEVNFSYKSSIASLKSAKASYDKNKTNLDYAYIYSPIDGIVLERAVEEGETVAASFSTPTLFTIANDLTRMEIEADVDEADIGQLRVGQRVEFTVDAFPGKTFGGEVTEIRLLAVEVSNVITYTVVINAPNPEKTLMPGMTANVVFYVTEKKDIVVVPNRAFEFNPDLSTLAAYQEANPGVKVTMPSPASETLSGPGKTIWVKKQDAICPQTVVLGETDEINYEVISGVQEGEEIILSLIQGSSGKGKPADSGAAAKSPFMPTPPGQRK